MHSAGKRTHNSGDTYFYQICLNSLDENDARLSFDADGGIDVYHEILDDGAQGWQRLVSPQQAEAAELDPSTLYAYLRDNLDDDEAEQFWSRVEDDRHARQ